MTRIIHMSIDELSPYIRRAGMQNGTSWKNRTRRIYDHEFYYCYKGKAYFLINGQQHEAVPGTLVVIKPDTPHSLWMDDNDPGDFYWVHFDYVYRKDVYNLDQMLRTKRAILYDGQLPQQEFLRPEPVFENGLILPEKMQIEERGLFEDVFKKIVFHFQNHEKYWQLECKILLLQLLKIIIIQISNHHGIPTPIDSSKVSDIVIRYIQKNYFRKLTLQELSRIAGLSPDYLGKVFKKETGMPITKFINRLRLAKAKELLLHTDLSLTDIAEMVGFSDIYYFSRVMKQYEGVAPTAWKKMMENI